jgi:predicted amidohydrolase
MIQFVPFCTDDRNGFIRVRYCCAARTIENQIYVTMSGMCGSLPNVGNMDVQYAQGAVLPPFDLPFVWNRMQAEAKPNVETMIAADVSQASLAEARLRGTVQNLSNRRTDLYGSGRKG